MPKPSIKQAALTAFAEVNGAAFLSIPRFEHIPDSASTTASCDQVEHISLVEPDTSADLPNAGHTINVLSKDLGKCEDTIAQTMDQAQQRQNLTACLSLHYNAEQSPYELDGLDPELPYVHANSLTGYSNDQSVHDILPAYEERRFLADSGAGLPIVLSSETQDMVGLNELVVDHDIMTPMCASSAANVALPMSLPATPPATPPLNPLSDIATILPVDCIAEAEYQQSDAHYCSEQALFTQTPLSLTKSTEMLQDDPNSSSINIADFLKLGHAKQCWCGYCTDEAYSDSRQEADASLSSSTTLADRDRAADDDVHLTLSMLINPSESEPDTESDDPELLDLGDTDVTPTNYAHANIEPVEDNDWQLFQPAVAKPVGRRALPASTMYTPSSPILHWQRQNRAPTPTVIITSSETSANETSDDYIAVAAPTTAVASPTATNLAWHDMFPRRPRSMSKADLAACEGERHGCGFPRASGGSRRWGRESEEEWWEWAVEEEC